MFCGDKKDMTQEVPREGLLQITDIAEVAPKGIIQQLNETVEQVKFELCDKYCKYPNTVDQFVLDNMCENCPMNNLYKI